MLKPCIKQIRKAQGRTATWTSEATGVSRDTLRSWEKGVSMPMYEKARLLAKVLGVTMEELYEEVEE